MADRVPMKPLSPTTDEGRAHLSTFASNQHHDNVDAAYECESGVDRCDICEQEADDILAIEEAARTEGRREAGIDKPPNEHLLGLAITAADDKITEQGKGASLWVHYIATEYARLNFRHSKPCTCIGPCSADPAFQATGASLNASESPPISTDRTAADDALCEEYDCEDRTHPVYHPGVCKCGNGCVMPHMHRDASESGQPPEASNE